MFHRYRFETVWKIEAPIDDIFQILRDGPRYSEWWSSYVVSEGMAPSTTRVVVRARTGYRVRFTTRLIAECRPTRLEIAASGDLVGTGIWELVSEGNRTDIRFQWEVEAKKKLIRWLSPLFRPFFKWNHDQVMRAGEKGLRQYYAERDLGVNLSFSEKSSTAAG